MNELIINQPQFNLDKITEGMFIEVKTKIGGNERTLNGVISGVERDKIWFLVSGGSTFAVNLNDVLDGKDQIKVASNLKLSGIEKMVKQLDIIYDIVDGHAFEIETDYMGIGKFTSVIINGHKYLIVPEVPEEVTCNLGTLNLK